MTGEHTDNIAAIRRDRLQPGEALVLSGAVIVAGTPAGKFPALITVSFRDAAGHEIAAPGLPVSALVGPYRYIGTAGQAGRIAFAIDLQVPPGATAVIAGLRGWSAQTVVPDAPLVIAPATDSAALAPLWQGMAAQADLLLAELTCDVTPGEGYDILAQFTASHQRVSDLLCMTVPVHGSPKGSMNEHFERNPGRTAEGHRAS